jgi:pimeloyl-ACP methyl ester carboxylesterase
MLSHGFPNWAFVAAPDGASRSRLHVLALRSGGYGHSSAPSQITAHGIGNLTDDLLGLLDHFGKDDAVFVGHDWAR